MYTSQRSPLFFRGSKYRMLSAALVLCAASSVSAHGDGARHLFFLPSSTSDMPSITRAFMEQGFVVHSLVLEPNDRARQAHAVAGELRALMANGVEAKNISVIGTGQGADVTILTSAAMGDRDINYVLLGHCDSRIKGDYRFRMAGRVLGIRDSEDTSSHSCRGLFQDAPKVRERQDLALNTGKAAALFDRPYSEWLVPTVNWVVRDAVNEVEVEASQEGSTTRHSPGG